MIGSFGEVLVMDWGLAKNLTTVRKEVAPDPTSETEAPARPPDKVVAHAQRVVAGHGRCVPARAYLPAPAPCQVIVSTSIFIRSTDPARSDGVLDLQRQRLGDVVGGSGAAQKVALHDAAAR